jgi:thiol-disulfide isomerase/thioredoxin
MSLLRSLSAVLLLFLPISVNAQQGRIWKWPQLEQYLTKQDDTVRVVNFWATWCGPCIKEMPLVLEAHKQFSGQPVKFLLVSLDFIKERDSKLLPFLARKQWEPDVVLLDEPDYNSWLPKVSTDWEGNIPCTVVVRNGTPKTLLDKELKGKELEIAINQKLSEKR